MGTGIYFFLLEIWISCRFEPCIETGIDRKKSQNTTTSSALA
jgi:hypothetical protein